MKKLIIAASVLLLIASSGCKGNDSSNDASSNVSVSEGTSQSVQESTSSAESSSASEKGDSVLSKYINVSALSEKSRKTMGEFLNSDELTIEAEGSLAAAKGFNVNFTAKIVKDADKSFLKFNFMNTDYTTLRTKDGVYSIDDTKKTAVFTPMKTDIPETSDSSVLESAKNALPSFKTLDITALSFVKDGEEEYEGTSYFCENYLAGDFTLKLYYDKDNHIKYLTAEKDGLVSYMKFNTLTQTADKSLLEIPSDYTIK